MIPIFIAPDDPHYTIIRIEALVIMDGIPAIPLGTNGNGAVRPLVGVVTLAEGAPAHARVNGYSETHLKEFPDRHPFANTLAAYVQETLARGWVHRTGK